MPRYLFLYEKHNHLTRKIPCKHIMQHLSYTSRSSIFRFGIGMLVLFFFCAPVHANYIPFQSTSNRPVISQPISNSINGSSNSNIVGEYKPYHPNVYVPFGDETPSSGNPLNNNGSGGSGDPNDDVGIPGWADTPSEPLPIGDTAPLFLFAAAMIAMIAIRQRRKQKQLCTQTSNNHSNNDTNDMTLTQHTRKSFRKLLMLALLLCVVGEVSADTYYQRELFNYSAKKGNLPSNFPSKKTSKYIHAKQAAYINGAFYSYDGNTPGLVKITNTGNVSLVSNSDYNETTNNNRTGTCRDDAGNLIINPCYSRLYIFTGADLTKKTVIEYTHSDLDNDCDYINASGDVINGTGYVYFFPYNTTKVCIIKITKGKIDGSIITKTGMKVTGSAASYVIPIDNNPNTFIYQTRNSPFYLYNNGTHTALTTQNTVGGAYFNLGGTNMFIQKAGNAYCGGWTMSSISTPSSAILTQTELGTGGYDANPSVGAFFSYERVNDYTIKLYEYCEGHGIAGWQIGTEISKSFRVQTYDGDSWEQNANGGTVSISYNDGSTESVTGTSTVPLSMDEGCTANLTATKKSGYEFVGWYINGTSGIGSQYSTPTTYIPTRNNYGTVTARFAKLTNQTINIQTYDASQGKYVSSVAGGTVGITYNDQGRVVNATATLSSTSGTYKALNSTKELVTLTANVNSGYVFVGWYDGSTQLSSEATYTYEPTAAKTIIAKFELDNPKKDVRAQTLVYESDAWDWKDNNAGGTFTMTHSGGTVYTHATDGYVRNIMVDKAHPVTFDAISNDGYTFLGWWNNPTVYTDDPWIMENPANYKQSVTARFAPSRQQTISVQTYDANTDQYDVSGNGGSVSINYTKIIIGSGYEENITEVTTSQSTYTTLYNTTYTLRATPKNGYEFLGWFDSNGNQMEWTKQYGEAIDCKADISANITARFHKPFTQAFDVQTEIGGQYQNSTTGGTATITYNNTTTNLTDQVLSISNMEQGTMVTLNATPKSGYRFVGWFNNSGGLDSSEPKYTYRAEGTRTVHARFARNDVQLVVAVMNYNTDNDTFEEYSYEYNTITLKQGNDKLAESYSSFKHKFDNETTVTLTAIPEEGEDGYDFVGWYIGNEKLTAGTNSLYKLTAANPTELTLYLSGAVAVNAHFAPKKCWPLEIRNNIGGTYTVRFSRNENFEQAFGMESSLDEFVYTYIPYVNEYDGVYMSVLNPKPILGYEFKGWRILDHGSGSTLKGLGDKFYYKYPAETQVVANFVRKDDQVVYLNLDGLEIIPNEWNLKADTATKYYAFAFNTCNTQQRWIEMTKVSEKLYTCTIPGGEYNRINFVHSTKLDLAENLNPKIGLNYLRDSLKQECRRSGFQTIPATRYNCFRIRGVYSSKTENGGPGYVDGWVAPPTVTGDYRLIYIEQEVASKTEITRTYEFIDGDRVQKIASGTKLDTVSLHIYNKVSKDNNGNLTGTALNNPEIILQQWDGTNWVDVERHMVFGPLQTDNTGHIRMPGRKNTAPVVDLGIDNIKTEKTDATKDYGSGVWNFVIEQNGATARLVIDQTHRYTGNYYIRTPNAEGQYHNFTHPGNIMSYSEYAKNNSDYSHYFIRFVDIYEDGTPTAEAGKHKVVKFNIANDYAINLCKEFTNTQNRFELEEDIYVLNAGDLPADATVRFGWDIVTNRLTRAYIADTKLKNNEYLVVEGTYIGSPTGEATYFNDNSNYLYSIDLNATKNAATKVKAKYNGQYQYFLGTEQANETLISGNGANTYPIRLLYDFKDDRFTTIYRPNASLSGTVNLETPVMIEREHNNAPTQITFNSGATIQTSGTFDQPAYAVMTFLESVLADASKTHHEKMFYWISFPFDVKISDVFGLGEYGKYWIMEEYDGAQRANNGLAKSNWKYITKKSAVLEKNKGYVLCLNYSQILQDKLFSSYGKDDDDLNEGKLSLYFPSQNAINPADISGNKEAFISLPEYKTANTAWNHHNWHIIGVPSFANPEFTDIQQDAPFVYVYWHPGDAYAAVSINDIQFQSMHAYMVQYTGGLSWTKIVNTTGSVTPKSLAAKTNEEADKKIMLRLELQQADSTIDKTYVQLRNDKGTKGFDMSLDLTKIINAGANIYSIVDNHEMAGNAIPKEETVLPLGVVITAAGDYTFAMPQGTEGMVVELIDYEQGTCTNLLVGDYTVNMPVGTNNTRFALRLVPDKVATSVEDITSGSNDNVRKLLIDGVLYLVKDGAVYDAQGHAIR